MTAEKTSVRVVAAFEAAKGLLVLVTASAGFEMFHRGAQRAAEELVRHSHLNPASKYPRIFVAAAANLTNTRLLLLALGALAYSLVRFAEGYGLWRGRGWARWLGLITAGLYVPVEVVKLVRHTNWAGAVVLSINLIVLLILWRARMNDPGPLDVKPVVGGLTGPDSHCTTRLDCPTGKSECRAC